MTTKNIGYPGAKGFTLSRNYFETSHRKSPCDGLGSIVKNTCLRAVTAGTTILGDAEAVYQFCDKRLAHGPQRKVKADGKVELSKWSFFFVDGKDVDHDRPGVFPLKGIRKVHSLQNIQKSGQIKSRSLSCFCESCRLGQTEQCENFRWVDNWKVHSLQSPGTTDSSTSHGWFTENLLHGILVFSSYILT